MTLTSYAGQAQRTTLDPQTLLVYLKDRVITSLMLCLAMLAILSILYFGRLHVDTAGVKPIMFIAAWFLLSAAVGWELGKTLSDTLDYHSDLMTRATQVKSGALHIGQPFGESEPSGGPIYEETT